MQNNILKTSWIDSPLGDMIAVADEERLYLLEFRERKLLNKQIQRLKINTRAELILQDNEVILSIKSELKNYFRGNLKVFETPFYLIGTHFQKEVWQELLRTPYGTTRSYLDQAKALNKPSAFRAVANANGCNRLAIIVPCHRILNNNGKLGGYASGLERKKWLIDMEERAV